jgi:hypothetical protein
MWIFKPTSQSTRSSATPMFLTFWEVRLTTNLHKRQKRASAAAYLLGQAGTPIRFTLLRPFELLGSHSRDHNHTVSRNFKRGLQDCTRRVAYLTSQKASNILRWRSVDVCEVTVRTRANMLPIPSASKSDCLMTSHNAGLHGRRRVYK